MIYVHVFIIVLAVLLSFVLLIWIIATLLYPEVNSGLRFLGFLVSVLTNYSSVKGLRRFARLSNKLMPLIFRPYSHSMDVERISIQGFDKHAIPIVIYKPKDLRPDATCFLWIHGGGFAIGTPGGEKEFLRPFVTGTNTVAIVPDYRLSVEAPYPAAFNDCRAVLSWITDNAGKLSINPRQIFLGGASAGGGLAISLALYARDNNLFNIAYLFPIYPMINDRMDTSSMIGNNGLLWNEKRNRVAWEQYLGELSMSEDVPCYASPLRASDFSGLPPAYTFVGTLDPFYDETLIFMEALQNSGVISTYDVYPGAFHGFDVIPSKLSRKARGRLLEVYKEAINTTFSDEQRLP